MTKSRATSRSVAATLGALALLASGTFATGSAHAREATPQAPREAQSALEANANRAPMSSGGLDLASINAPMRVTRPGAKSLHRIGFTNMATPPVRIHYRLGGTCFDAKGKIVNWQHKPKAVKIPSGGSRPDPKTRAMRLAWLKVPKTCARAAGRETSGRDGSYFYRISVKGGKKFKAYATGAGGFLLGHAPAKYRKNLFLVSTPPGPAKRYDAHHTLPKELRPIFKKKGLDIDDTIHLRWWCKSRSPGYQNSHRAWAKRYNRTWKQWLDENPEATRKQVWKFRDKLDKEYRTYYVCPQDR